MPYNTPKKKIKKVKNSIDKLYEVFSIYPANRNMFASPLYNHKIEKWRDELFNAKLEEIETEDLYNFCSSVMLTWGEEEDYKHFLPRIYELIADYNSPYEVWIILDRLNDCKWRKWRMEEVNCVELYINELWLNLQENSEYRFRDYFSAIANIYPNFDEMLLKWQISTSRNSAKNLAIYFNEEYENIFVKKILPGFKPNIDLGLSLFKWITSEAMIKKIEKDYFKFEEENFAADLSKLLELIENTKKGWR